jgi:hypothetical protein
VRRGVVRRDRSIVVEGQRTPNGGTEPDARTETRGGDVLRRRPPCRNFGGDPRSQELAVRIVRHSKQISALHRELLSDIAEFDRAESWRGDGATSMIAWVTAQCGVSTATARQWVRSGDNLESLPCLAEGLAAGELSLDLVEPLAEVASPSNDAALREASRHWSVRQARELATWHRAQKEAEAVAAAAAAAAPDPSSDEAHESEAAREFDRRTLRLNDTKHSMWMGFTKEDYAAAKSVLVRRVEAERLRHDEARRSGGAPTAGSAAGSDPLGYVPYDKLLYDALIDLFQVGIGSGSASAGGRAPGATVRPRVVVHAPLELLIACSSEGVAEIAGVGPVAVEVVRRLACDAKVDLAVEDGTGSILNQGRARRHPTPVQSVEIDRRDRGCRFPGCNYTEFTHAHHIAHWAHGGLTNMDNLVTLCGRHHRAVHELGWSVSGNADAMLTFKSPHGNVMQSVPSPTWHSSSAIRSGRSGQNLGASGQKPGRNGPLRR